MRIIGVDPGFAHIGIAIVEISGSALSLLSAQTLDGRDSAAFLHRFDEICQNAPDWIVMEGFTHPPNYTVGAKIMRVMGIVEGIAYCYGIKLNEISPQEIITQLGLDGTKQARRNLVSGNLVYGRKLSQHEIDACTVVLALLKMMDS